MSHYKYVNPFNKKYISITAIEKYSNISFEEMRWEFYQETNPTCAIENDAKNPSIENNFRNVSNIEKFDGNKNIIEDDDRSSIEDDDMYQICENNLCDNNEKTKKPVLKNIHLLKENESKKRNYSSETEYSRTPKKMRYKSDSSDDQSSEEEVINKSIKRNVSHDDEFDLLTKSIGKRIKVNDAEKSVFCKKWRYRRRVVKAVVTENVSEERRIVAHIDLLRNEGNTLVKNGDYSGAYHCYSTAINCSFNYPSLSSICHSNRALCLLKMNKMPEALADCVSAISLDSKNYKACLRKIKCLIELGRYEDAQKDTLFFNETYKVGEGRELLTVVTAKLNFASLTNEGDDFLAKNLFNEALVKYSAAIEIDSGVSLLYKKRAAVLFVMARYSESLTDLDDALATGPHDDDSVRSKIECLVKLERFHEATKIAIMLQQRSPSSEHDGLVQWSNEMERLANERNFYQILGVNESASVSDIKRRYKKLSLLYHPDKLVSCDPEAKAIQEEKFKNLNQIYNTLSDPVSRRMYDIELRCRYRRP